MIKTLAGADEANIAAEILALSGAAAAVRDIIRLSWQADTIDSAEVQAIAERYGLLELRAPTQDEMIAGAFAVDDAVAQFDPVFGTIVDNLDAADAAAEASAADTEGVLP